MRNDKRLKIHREDEPKTEDVAQRLSRQLPIAKKVCSQFENLTGWVLNYDLEESELKHRNSPDQSLWGKFAITDLSESIGPGKKAIHRGNSEDFVESMNWFVERLSEHQRSLELGDQGFRFFDYHTSPNKSDVLANQLINLAKTLKAESAALYLLDDETTQLKIRACVGTNQKPQQLAANRPLEHSLADLEALVGNVVQINKQDLSPAWNLPEPFENGACLTVGSEGMPLGTMWIFFEEQRQLSPQEVGMLEAVALEVGTELVSRKKPEIKTGQVSQMEQDVRNASRINDGRLPHFSPEIDGWKIAGWTYRKDKLTGNFHDWAVTPSGGLSVSIGQVAGSSIPATINANNLRSLICAHRDYRHDARKMVQKLNENVWTNSPGDELASLIYTLVDPETGTVQVSNAGDGGVVIFDGKNLKSIDQFQDPLGLEMESDYLQWEGVLEESQSIILFSQGLRTAFCELTSAVDDADLFGKMFEDCQGEPDLILAAIQDTFFQSDFQIDAPDLSVVVLTKKQPPQAQYYYGQVEETVEAGGARGNLAAGDPEVEKSFNAFIEAISVGNVQWVQGETDGNKGKGSSDESNESEQLNEKGDDDRPASGDKTVETTEPGPPDPSQAPGENKDPLSTNKSRKEERSTTEKVKKTRVKRTSAKKATPKKSPVKRTTSRKKVSAEPARKKTATKRATAKKAAGKTKTPPAKKASAKRATKTPAKKQVVARNSSSVKKASTAVKKVVTKKAVTKKAAAKKTPKKSTPKKSTVKKTVSKKAATNRKAIRPKSEGRVAVKKAVKKSPIKKSSTKKTVKKRVTASKTRSRPSK